MPALGKLLLLPLGLIIGAGGGAGVAFLLPAAPPAPAVAPASSGDSKFVTLGALLVPVTLPDGQLTAYVTVEPQLELGEDDVEPVTARIPLIIDAVNVRTFATPLASGPDGRLPDAAAFKAVVAKEAARLLGPGVVRSVAITRIAPA